LGISKIKNLVITALVLINVFFLALIIYENSAGAQSARQAVQNASAVLEAAGITINPDNVAAGGALREMTTSRCLGAEGIIADALLGPAVMTDQGAIHHYESGRGVASFYIRGDFEASLNEGAITSQRGALRTVRTLLRTMRIEASEFSVSGESGNETVVAVASYRRTSIFNCTIEFIFIDGSLRMVRGRHLTGIEPMEDGAEISSAGTALLRFLAAVKNGEHECSHIYSVEAGYWHHVAGPAGDGVLLPAWLITADTGRFIVEGGTGEVRLVA